MMPVLVHFELNNKPVLTPCLWQSLQVFLDTHLFSEGHSAPFTSSTML